MARIEKEKRSETITIRLSTTEFERLRKLVIKSGDQMISSYCRKLIFDIAMPLVEGKRSSLK